jgi:hypothetical protein
VRATPVAGPDCAAARSQWLATMGWTGLVDAGTGALQSGATLSVGFNPAEVDQDLCAPSLTPGFLGARNECYRVAVSRPGCFVWGRDDAAPVYRVRVEAVDGQMRRIVFLTQPRDEQLRPRAGQTVELLRWDERLPNGQKTAEPLGRFHTVASGLVDGAITLSAAVDAATLAWLAGLPAADLSAEDAPGEQRYFYLRLWTGGGSAGQPDQPLAAGDLAGTGLSLGFSGTPLPGDHWIIAARPNAPTQVLPWGLKAGKPADGPRRHVLPLAVVDLDAGTVTDCRRRFRPLYRQGGCCTVTVGDEQNSWGDVSSIAAAIERLPAAGGEICLGPGTWREHIVLDDRRDIVFTGCGARTHWLAADPALPPLTVRRSTRIRLRRLHLEGVDAPALLAPAPGQQEAAVQGLALEDCLLASPSGGVLRAVGVQQLSLLRCRVDSGPLADPKAANAAFAALSLQGEALTVQACQVRALAGELPQALALGGVHIGGNSRDVVLSDNLIQGGAGQGITLGSVHLVRIPAPAFKADPNTAVDEAVKAGGGSFELGGFFVTIDDAGCIHLGQQDPGPQDGGDDTVEVPVSDGAVWRTLIARNRIADCGGSGIATFPLLPVDAQGAPAWDAVAVEWLEISDNDIRGCCLREPAPLPPLQRLFSGQGGIVLGMAIDVTVRDNRIQDNGLAPGRAASGVFIGYGEGVRVERNQIERNGATTAELGASIGGIVVRAALGGAVPGLRMTANQADPPALLVQGNVVHAPSGRALKALAQGPVLVSGNRFTGAQQSALFANPLQALVLFLLGAGSAAEVLSNPDDPDALDLLLFDALIDLLGGDAVSLVNLSLSEEFLFAYRAKRAGYGLAGGNGNGLAMGAGLLAGPQAASFRGGETLFANNQVSLRGGLGKPAAHLCSVLLIALDDLAFADNQCELESDVAFSIADAVLVATTLRATGNRLQEPVLCIGSLMSLGIFMNTTALNQSTFFTFAQCSFAAKLVDVNNMTLI